MIEQLFTAELYLWNMLWERKCKVCNEKGGAIPKLTQVRRPSLLNNFPDMNHEYK